MDNSVSKALIIVASVLLAMLVIAFLTFSFNKMGEWASASEEEVLIEQKDKFNKEYEVYDKDLMYGVDVISCLNKAKSNNDKIQGKYAEALDESYELKVTVNLKDSKLTESLTVYHILDGSGNQSNQVAYTNGAGPTQGKKTLKQLKFKFLDTAYSSLSNTFSPNMQIKTVEGKKIDLGTSNLILTKDSDDSSTIVKLLSTADAISQVVTNYDTSTKNDENGWTKVEFRSALYDLKTRKFKCTKLEYSPDTGRVNFIEFKEI